MSATLAATWRRFGLAARIIVGIAVLGLVLAGIDTWRGDASYHARLRHAAGIAPGDDVRVAGLTVGAVTAVEADRDQVDVTFTLDRPASELGLTDDSTVEVKLLSILGERFLSLAPGEGDALGDGDTIAVTNAIDSYTIERFWLESTPQVEGLDLERIQEAVDVLATDLAIDPRHLRDALDGITGVSEVALAREEQLDALLTSIRQVTDVVLEQTDQLDRIMTNGTAVLLMVHERRELLRTLLSDAHRFVTGLNAVVRETAPHLRPALRNLQTTLRVLDEHRDDLETTLRLAGPTMRVFTNATGDGPWLGVNAPWAIVPDDLVCDLSPEDCS